MRLKGKVSIVTGGGQGIGAAIAVRFAAEGAAVAIADTNEEKGQAIATTINRTGGKAIFVRTDVSDPIELDNLVASVVRSFGDIDVCVCCAGIARVIDFLEMQKAEFDQVVAINLIGPFLLGQRVARHMVSRAHGGSIINVSSVSAVLANPGQEAYCASKAGLCGLTRAMAVSVAPRGIRVNALAPGPTMTTMAVDNPQFVKPVLSRTPLGRFAQPSEMADAALFLASEESSFMTGGTLFIDGGRLALNYTMPSADQPRYSADESKGGQLP